MQHVHTFSDEQLYEHIIVPVSGVKEFVWIGTADIKDLHVHSGRTSSRVGRASHAGRAGHASHVTARHQTCKTCRTNFIDKGLTLNNESEFTENLTTKYYENIDPRITRNESDNLRRFCP